MSELTPSPALPARLALRIAFAACNKNAARFGEDASFTYRCDNLARALREQGHTVWLGHASQLPWRERWNVVVFHRPRMGWRFSALHAWLRRCGTRVVADVDDLVFDPGLAHHSPGVANSQVSLRTTKHQFLAHQQALATVEYITVSTVPLLGHAQAQFKQAQVTVLPNTVHWRWRDMPPNSVPRQHGLMCYLPGTRSHDRDFGAVASAVERLLKKHAHLRLHITGPLNFQLNARPGQVTHQARLPFDQFHKGLLGASVNLAPLEDTPFTRCKSAIKVMEAAWWGIPTVCSSLPDAQRFVNAGAHLAMDEMAFEATLERLLTDEHYYANTCNGLRERVLPLADVHAVARNWLSFVLGADDPVGGA